MNAKTPHAMRYAVLPFSDAGKEVSAHIIVRLNLVDTYGSMTEAEMVEALRQRMAEVMDCDPARINAFKE